VRGRVLIVAGSDSGGGAGIQADIKTVTMLGAFAATAITALTAQNTEGVFGVLPIDPAFIRRQMEVVLDDIGADAIKTGMLHDSAVIETVAAVLDERAASVPLVVDPVMVAKGGARLLRPEAVSAMRAELLPLATVITPNLPEATVLLGRPVVTLDDRRAAARDLHALGPKAVVVKGGHAEGDATDVLFDGDQMIELAGPRIDTRNTHGSGCTFSAAIAAGLARGLGVVEAVREAKHFITEAIRAGLEIGEGHGPVNPMWALLNRAVD
jgi:hydroxymethylpyrimidine/phosphomethylpyrimidine kinase